MHNIKESQAIRDAAIGRIERIRFKANLPGCPLPKADVLAVCSELAETRKVMAQMAAALEALRNANPDVAWQYHGYADAALEAYRKLEKPNADES